MVCYEARTAWSDMARIPGVRSLTASAGFSALLALNFVKQTLNRDPLIIDKHTLAVVSIVGSSLDVLGALYLAYDLLGGEHGPLRTLTRGVTYGALFGTGYGLTLGPVFGLASGLAHGLTLAWEYSRASKNGPKPGFWYDTAMSAIRACGFALGAGYLFGPRFGWTFGALSAAGQVVAYRVGIRPTLDYAPAARLRLTKLQILAAVNRTVGYVLASYIAAVVAGLHGPAVTWGLAAGLAIGAVTAVANACTPLIEWGADHVPQKRMGVLGVALILIGFALQSVQYWLALLDVNIR